MATLSAQIQGTAPPRVFLTASQLGPGGLSLYRLVAGTRAQVRGAVNVQPSAGEFLAVDNEAPFGVPVQYAMTQGTTETLSNVVELEADHPWITNPVSGEGVSATIVDWPELVYAARLAVLDVAGRVRPVVVSDLRTSATSQLVLLTRTRAQLLALRGLVAPGDVVQIRPVCDAVEGDYYAVGDVSEARYRPNSGADDPNPAGSDWRRLVSLDLTAVDQPSPALPAVGDTLADLATFVPTTLADIATTWPPPATLLTIAQTQLHAASS